LNLIMLRNLNDPTETQPKTTADQLVVTACPICGSEVQNTIPEGTLQSVAQFMRRLTPECEPCTAKIEQAAMDEERRKMRRQRADRSGLPGPLRGLGWESYEIKDKRWPKAAVAVDAAKRWVEEAQHRKPTGQARRGLWLSGPVGTGKTRLAVTAAWELLLYRDVRYVSVPDLIITLSAAFGDQDRALALKVLTGRGPLILDDLDKIPPSPHVLSHLYTAINSRYEARSPLFVTSNLKPDELVAFLAGTRDDAQQRAAAEASVSRLMELCRIGHLTGPDRRRG
jgi:DNA replication protein DnaC